MHRLRVRRHSFKRVGVERFELSTSRTRTVRSTGLSHTPDGVHYTIVICFVRMKITDRFLYDTKTHMIRIRQQHGHVHIELRQKWIADMHFIKGHP